MALQDSGIFIASSLIADTPEKDKENAEPTGDTPRGGAGPRSGEGISRSARKSLLGRRRSSMGRRISGFGGGGFDVNANQSELTSMYTSIIKLNTENKITRDKCWGLKLIDFMDRVILDEGAQMSGSKVNFQKASCTLDASVKIYSHRVDSTHISSFSLLENLNRGDKSTADDGSGAAVGSAERSTRLGVHETLKKADQLDQSETDRAFKMDPMFHKMSKIFDEAGSKGMLLNNLNVSDGCKVSFDSAPPTAGAPRKVFARPGGPSGDDGGGADEEKSSDGQDDEAKAAEEEAEAAADKEMEAARGMTDIRDLRATLSSICGDLSSLALCPQLQEFREQIAEIEEGPRESAASFGGGAGGGDDSDSDGGGGGGGGFDDIPGSDGASFDGGADFGAGGGDDDVPELGGGGDGSDDADLFHADNGDGFGGGGGGVSFLGGGDDDGDAGFGSGSGDGGGGRGSTGSGETAAGTVVSLEDRLCVDMKIVNDDYAFYDTGALAAAAVRSSNNHWAGASHWKFVGVKKKRSERKKSSEVGAEEGGENDADGGTAGGAGGGRKARGKRRPPAIDFDAPPVPENALAPPPKPKTRGRRGKDVTLLSEEYVMRALKAAEDASSNYALPENAGFKTKDLAELFLRKGAFTKRWAAGEAGGERADLQGFHDSNGGRGGGGEDDLLFGDANDGYAGGDDFGDDDDDDEIGSEGFHFAGGFDLGGAGGGAGGAGGGAPEVGADGVFVDNFEGQGLLSAERRVEKISVNYARKAKKVDVRRLKGDLWRKIDREFKSDAAAAAAAVVQDNRRKDVENDGSESGEAKRKDDAENEDAEHDGSGTQDAEGKEQEEKVATSPEVVDMTFSNIVLDVASREEQSGVTVPFYFICLLHLANEKGLKLEGRDDLLDFSVESDPVKEGYH